MTPADNVLTTWFTLIFLQFLRNGDLDIPGDRNRGGRADSSWNGAKEVGHWGLLGLQHRLGRHSPGTWGTTDKIDNNTQHDLPAISHYLTEKIPLSLSVLFLTLITTPRGLES